MIDLLIFLLRPALLCTEGGRWWLAPVALLAWVIDVILAHTTWALVAGWPRRNEWTISHTLERLCMKFDHPDHGLFVAIAKKINRISPTRSHIKAVL